jgi:hypothetical protein
MGNKQLQEEIHCISNSISYAIEVCGAHFSANAVTLKFKGKNEGLSDLSTPSASYSHPFLIVVDKLVEKGLVGSLLAQLHLSTTRPSVFSLFILSNRSFIIPELELMRKPT